MKTKLLANSASTQEANVSNTEHRRLWTAWCDYFATGEGRTLLAQICCAADAEECRREFAKVFTSYFYCDVSAGVVRNEVVLALFPEATLSQLSEWDGKVHVAAQASLHFNLS